MVIEAPETTVVNVVEASGAGVVVPPIGTQVVASHELSAGPTTGVTAVVVVGAGLAGTKIVSIVADDGLAGVGVVAPPIGTQDKLSQELSAESTLELGAADSVDPVVTVMVFKGAGASLETEAAALCEL
jgi:hypothetical protein